MGNESFSFKVGQFNCLAINDSHGGNFNCLLIDTGQHKVLIETGLGDVKSPRGWLMDQLQSAGISPSEIDVVIFSHADVDHIGGAADASGTPTFPQARYVLLREEWDFWSSKPERLPPSEFFDEEWRRLSNTVPVIRLPQLHDQLEPIAAETEIVPGIRAVATPGHTPGHMAITVSSGEERLLFIGDILYGGELNNDQSDPPKELGDRAFHAVVDVNPAQALLTRDRLFAQAASEQTLLMGYHTPFPGLGYIVQHGTGWRWQAIENTD
jgi:glyoxylase-like metal-dependent hydrolase (beta-lactamase superfamily II)